MGTVTLPIVEDNATQAATIKAMRTAKSRAAAVRVGNRFQIVPVSAVVNSDLGDANAGDVARLFGVDLPMIGVDVANGRVTFRRDQIVLPRFDAPAGYKECSLDSSHTYSLDDSRTSCWRDGGSLLTIYMSD